MREDPAKKVAVLKAFCEHIGVDPDTLIATSTDLVPTGKAERNKHLKALKVWINRCRTCRTTQGTKPRTSSAASSSRTASR